VGRGARAGPPRADGRARPAHRRGPLRDRSVPRARRADAGGELRPRARGGRRGHRGGRGGRPRAGRSRVAVVPGELRCVRAVPAGPVCGLRLLPDPLRLRDGAAVRRRVRRDALRPGSGPARDDDADAVARQRRSRRRGQRPGQRARRLPRGGSARGCRARRGRPGRLPRHPEHRSLRRPCRAGARRVVGDGRQRRRGGARPRRADRRHAVRVDVTERPAALSPIVVDCGVHPHGIRWARGAS